MSSLLSDEAPQVVSIKCRMPHLINKRRMLYSSRGILYTMSSTFLSLSETSTLGNRRFVMYREAFPRTEDNGEFGAMAMMIAPIKNERDRKHIIGGLNLTISACMIPLAMVGGRE